MIVQKEISLLMLVIVTISQNHLVIKKSTKDFSYLRKSEDWTITRLKLHHVRRR
jgi:hypothetical protein